MIGTEVLRRIYYNPSNPAAFSTALKLYHAAQLIDPSITLNRVKQWLLGELTYTLHKPIRKNFKRNRVFVESMNEQFQADLVDMNDFSRINKGYKYILTIIDVFSKYAFAVPIKNKTGNEVKSALVKIFRQRKPMKIQTDQGKEFKNRIVQNYLKSKGVIFFTSYNKTFKCSIVERFNRTLKAKMFKFFTSKGKKRYIDNLQDFVDSYNRTKHRTIKMRPIDVNLDNQDEVFYNTYGVETTRDYLMQSIKGKQKSMLRGEKVRRKYDLRPMEKSYLPNWSDEIYTVEKSIKGTKPMYSIRFNSQSIPGKFYPEELQRVRDQVYRVEKVVKTRLRNGRQEYFVKWVNYPSSYNSWVTNLDDI